MLCSREHADNRGKREREIREGRKEPTYKIQNKVVLPEVEVIKEEKKNNRQSITMVLLLMLCLYVLNMVDSC